MNTLEQVAPWVITYVLILIAILFTAAVPLLIHLMYKDWKRKK